MGPWRTQQSGCGPRLRPRSELAREEYSEERWLRLVLVLGIKMKQTGNRDGNFGGKTPSRAQCSLLAAGREADTMAAPRAPYVFTPAHGSAFDPTSLGLPAAFRLTGFSKLKG